MPICKKCDSRFKINVVIDGKQRNLSNRSHCLSCLPFKAAVRMRRGRIASRSLTYGTTRTCKYCGKKFAFRPEIGHRPDVCNSCSTGVRRERTKAKCVAYLGGKCEKCGYNRCHDAFDFHHRDPETKRFTIGGGAYSRRWEDIQKELDSCSLLCANCHRELHARENKSNLDASETLSVE